MLQIVLLSAVVAWGATILAIFYQCRARKRLCAESGSLTSDEREPQRNHIGYTPRIGGLPIMLGFGAGLAWAAWTDWAEPWWFGAILLCALPAWGGGVLEDITRRLGIAPRLGLTLIAAALALFLLDVRLIRLDIAVIDDLLVRWPLLAMMLTLFAVGGLPHAMNLIDGFNGLAGMVALLILTALGYVAYKLGDSALLAICLALGASTAGFFFWNYPRGLIFAGDGGAYLWGSVIGFISVLLVIRHPAVSPWFPMLLCIYPVWETLFSIYRRAVVRRRSPLKPDGLHFHTLIYKRLVRWMVNSRDLGHLVNRNSLTAPYLWSIALMSAVPAVLYWENSMVLSGFCAVFVLSYLWLYTKLVRFRAPRILQLRRQ